LQGNRIDKILVPSRMLALRYHLRLTMGFKLKRRSRDDKCFAAEWRFERDGIGNSLKVTCNRSEDAVQYHW
jgi:hypothetical protein